MYVDKPIRKNVATVLEGVSKRKKVVPNFVWREGVIAKYNSGEKLANYRIENPDSGMKWVFKGSKYPDVTLH